MNAVVLSSGLHGDRPTVRRAILFFLGLFLAGACDLTSGPDQTSSPNAALQRSMLAPAVQQYLNDGQLVFPPATWRVTSPARLDSMLATSANELRIFHASGLTRYYEEDHGGPIAWSELHPCGRRFHVRSQIASLPASVAFYIRQAFASSWVGNLCNALGQEEMTVIVADEESVLRIENGRFRSPWSTGNELQWWGVYPVGEHGLPLSPEQAVVFAATALGTRIASLPEAWRWFPTSPPPNGYPSQCVLWKLTLTEPHAFRDSFDEDRETTEVYVGRYPACARGEPAFWLPRGQSFSLAVDTGTAVRGTMIAVPLADPIYFDRVMPSGGRDRPREP